MFREALGDNQLDTVCLAQGAGVRLSVSRYRAGQRQVLHRDAYSRISVVLGGSFREETRAGAGTARAGDTLVKPRAAAHENEFADASILSLEFVEDDPLRDREAIPLLACGSAGWLRSGDLIAAATARDASRAALAAYDILAATEEPPAHSPTPPRWLAQMRAALEAHGLSGVDVAAAAKKAGAHPAHASRLFRRCYGVSITEFALAHATRRAMATIFARADGLADIAAVAGFYDQSHMNRAFRRYAAMTPGAYRRLIAACG